MKIPVLFLVAGFYMSVTGAYAATDASKFAKDWGNPKIESCATPNFTSSNGCLSNCDGKYNGRNAMVARAINSHGAKFCLTYINSKRNNSSQKPWTEYHQAVGLDDTSCVWLCKSGWGGDECNTSTSGGTIATTCDISTIKSSTYKGKSDACTSGNKNISCSTLNVESSIQFLVASKYYDCDDRPFGKDYNQSSNKDEEHDVVLGITGWTTSGHGAFAQPLTVRAYCPRGTNDGKCAIVIKTQKTKELLCKDGYKPNSAKTDCEAINGYVCQGIKDCSGWSISRFQGADYKTVVVNKNGGSCTQYRCANANHGFVGDPKIYNTCRACSGEFEKVSDDNGQCVEDTEAKKKAEEEAKAKAEAEAKAKAEAEARAKAEAEAAAQVKAAEEEKRRLEEELRKAQEEADARAKAEVEAQMMVAEEEKRRLEEELRKAQEEAEMARNQVVSEAAEEGDASYENVPLQTVTYTQDGETVMMYVIGKAEMQRCWQKNESTAAYKECMRYIIGNRAAKRLPNSVTMEDNGE